MRALLFSLLLLPPTLALGFSPDDTNRVLVVWNGAWTRDNDFNGVQDSEQIKDAYVSMRGIPTNHVLEVTTLPAWSYPTHTQFFDELVSPITNALATIGPTNIDVITVIYGIPVRVPGETNIISTDNVLMNLYNLDRNTPSPEPVQSPYLEPTPTFFTDNGHFNHNAYQVSGEHMYMVCRLSAPDAPRGVLNQLMQTRYAETYMGTNGIKGPLYLDTRWGPYTHSGLATNADVIAGNYLQLNQGDLNIAYTESYMTNSGIDLQWENLGTDYEIGEAGAGITNANEAWFYMGWYNFTNYNDVFDWLPGSVGCDLNSSSGFGLYDGSSWIGGAFQQGLTAAAGVLGEPYLNGHARPNVLAYYLLQGYTFAEASHLATPLLEWQAVNLGDPLYAPLAHHTIGQDTNPPVFLSGYPAATNRNTRSATIPFQIQTSYTNPEVASAVLTYGLTPDCEFTNSSQKGFWFWNEWDLQDLLPGTTYYYRVFLSDPAGNTTNSSLQTFTTYPEIDLETRVSTNGYLLRWDSDTNHTYSILAGTDLTLPFGSLATNIVATPPMNTYTTAAPASPGTQFYRVRIEP